MSIARWIALGCALAFANLASATAFITSDPYPPAAIAGREHGSAVVQFTIDTQGRVENCQIARSSGSPNLDAATCPLLVKRARYSPKTDAKNNPVDSAGQLTVHWVFPREPLTADDLPLAQGPFVMITYNPDFQDQNGELIDKLGSTAVASHPIWDGLSLRAPEGFSYAAIIKIGSDGRVQECDVRRSSGSDAIDQAICTHLVRHARYKPATDKAGAPVSTSMLAQFRYVPNR